MTALEPIGIFDSGLGGLTVVRAIRRQLAGIDIVYFADTARIPYGTKSPETVTRYAREIAAVLLERGARSLVVACNTASALALPQLAEELDVPVLGVLEPGARAAAAATRSGHIAVLGTHGTVSSGAYARALSALRPDLAVQQIACPLFVPLVEEQWTVGTVPEEIARHYLSRLHADTDTIILGCTHYPLVKALIHTCVGPDIQLIDSAEATALEFRALVAPDGWQPPRHPGDIQVLTSDTPQTFAHAGAAFLGQSLMHVEWHRW